MRLPFRRWIHLCGALLGAAAIVLTVPQVALAWHGHDGWRHRPFYEHHHHGDWGGRWYRPAFHAPPFFFPPPPFRVRVYPGYYPTPYYHVPYRGGYYEDEGYFPGPPAYAPAPPFAVNLGFNWVFRH